MTDINKPEFDDAESCCSQPVTTRNLVSSSRVGTSTDEPVQSRILSEFEAEEMPAEVAALRATGFRLLLEGGRPVDQEDWAAEAGVNRATVSEVLKKARSEGRVELDSDGKLIGIAGLTIEPTRHRLDIGGVNRWTWCALDAIGILGALRTDGTIHSTDPGTGDNIEIAFRSGMPDGTATVFILGGHRDANLREDWCPMVNFFTDRPAAERWVLAHQLEGDIFSITQLAEEAAEIWKPVVDHEADLGSVEE